MDGTFPEALQNKRGRAMEATGDLIYRQEGCMMIHRLRLKAHTRMKAGVIHPHHFQAISLII